MKKFRFAALTLTWLLVAGAATTHASDPIAVYARGDRVVLRPSAEAPQTIQIFGVFSLATPNDRNAYEPPARGYLYFKLAENEAMARREWADLKSIAGTKQIVSFGNRQRLTAKLRAATAPPEDPDAYLTGWGLTKVSGDTTYTPIRALAAYRE